MRDDGRLEQAKAIPILEVAHMLGIDGLRAAGVEKVGPCPACGGDDRFGIHPVKQVFTCRKCGGAGDGVALVQLAHGCDFKAALAFLVGEADAQIDPAVIAARQEAARAAKAKQDKYAADARAFALREAREIWERSANGEGTPAQAYLRGRGIRFDIWPPTLRFIADHPYKKSVNHVFREIHRGPAMIAAIQDGHGQITAVHQTWIDPARPGEKAKISFNGEAMAAKLVRGSKKGGAIRLSPRIDGGVMVMGEGIETTGTALSAAVVENAVYWAGVDLGNMAGLQERVTGKRNSGLPDMSDTKAFVPPDWVSGLIYIQDGDSAPGPTRAKLEAGLRRAMRLRPGITAQIVHPGGDFDLNDLGRGAGKKQEQQKEGRANEQ